MDSNLVTVIITTHNRLPLLKRAIDSVYAQTYKFIELIVVDDASTDDTSLYCKNQLFQYVYISAEESKGGNYARNKGIRLSKGTYIAFLDDDDYWLPTKIEKQVRLIKEKKCELVYCGKRLEIVEEGKTKYIDVFPKSLNSGNFSRRILYTTVATTSDILVTRQALFEVGLFDENLQFWQEYELTIRLAQRSSFYFVNEVLDVYRINCKDKQRLTNLYLPWQNAVNYIYHKHRDLYLRLNTIERTRVHLRILIDGAKRCKASGFKYKYYYKYLIWFIFSFPLRIWDKFISQKTIIKNEEI